MFRVEYAVHLKYAKGTTTFRRETQLPFAPFIGLDVLDNSLGQFTLEQVAWCSEPVMFLCQSSVDYSHWTLQKACRSMRQVGWEEDKESRRGND